MREGYLTQLREEQFSNTTEAVPIFYACKKPTPHKSKKKYGLRNGEDRLVLLMEKIIAEVYVSL